MSKPTIGRALARRALASPPLLAAGLLLAACHPHPVEKSDPGEALAAAPRDALVGHRAPAVTLDGLDGERIALADLIGHKPVYLKFWATWCKPCREQMPHLEAAHRRYGDRIAT